MRRISLRTSPQKSVANNQLATIETGESSVNKYGLCIAAGLLGGCASLPSTYNPKSLPSDQLASVSPYQKEVIPFMSYDGAEIISVFDETKNKVIGKNMSTYHENVTLAEGNYHFVVRCSNGNMFSYPQASAHLDAGESYTIFCESIIVDDGYWKKLSGHHAQIVNSKAFSADMIDRIVVKEY